VNGHGTGSGVGETAATNSEGGRVEHGTGISTVHGESQNDAGTVEHFPDTAFQNHDHEPVELRSDKDIQSSVSSAWQATDNGKIADCTGLDEEASLPNMKRKIMALASGSFVSHLDVGGLRIWDLDTPVGGLQPVPLDQALPSDSRLRPDLIALRDAVAVDDSTEAGRSSRNELLEVAQVAKDDLENEKRAERRCRRISEHANDPFFPQCMLDAVTK
jgi:hypothetical protein